MTFSTQYKMPLTENLTLTQDWDKVFPKSDKVDHAKVMFVNRYGITLAADLYAPKNIQGKLPAIAVASPYGAVKEQSGGLYAQTMAERGFVTLVFDPSFTGESGGAVRQVSSPDINTEDFSAAVDYLTALDIVDEDRIGVIGICGWGGLAISVAAYDPRIKATVSSTMGSFDDFSHEDRIAARKGIVAQRSQNVRTGSFERFITVPNPMPAESPDFMHEYHNYYCTERGFHPRSVNSGLGWNSTSWISHWSFSLFDYAEEIENPVLLVHGENAFSRYASEKVFGLLKGDNKELYIVPNATHVDLYDDVNKIPFDKMEAFFKANL